MKFEIKQRFTGAVLFSLECEGFKVCVEAAVKAKTNMSHSNLRNSDLSGADLSGADLSYSDLRGSDLSGADLSGAYLRNSNLRNSDLSGADLSYSDLSYSNLRGADLRGSAIVAHIGQPDGWHAYTYFDTKLNEQRVQVGCQNKTLAEGREYCANKENRREVLAALDYAEAIGKLRGWGAK